MSLINEALKKAQQDRAVGEALAAPTSYEQVNRSSSGPGFLKILIAAIFVASIFGGAVAFLVLGVMGPPRRECRLALNHHQLRPSSSRNPES